VSAIDLAKGSLRSQVVRNIIGERTIDIYKELTTDITEDSEGNPLSWIIGAGARLAGFVLGGLARAGGLLLGTAVRWLIQSVIQLSNFNWLASDTAIKDFMEGNNLAIASALGALVGGGGVWLTSIGIASAAAIQYPVLGGKIALELAEEGGEELRGYLRNFVTQTGNTLAQNALLYVFLQSRRAWRKANGMPAAVADGQKPWTISGTIENWAGDIGGTWLRTFVESAIEEASDAAMEAGFILSYALDDYYQSAKLAAQDNLGEHRTIKIIPDKQQEEEFITLSGPQTLLQQDVQTALTTHRWVHNRDLGQIVGQPAEDWLRAGMQRRKLTIVFKSKEKPPWIVPEGRVKQVAYTVPEPDIGLTWQKLKLAAKPFNWGRYRATVNLDNGRQMAIYGATAAEAEDKIKELLPLSTGNLLTLSVSEEKDRHINLRKHVVRMYPAYATLLIRRSTAELTGTNDLSGDSYRQETIRIDLWPDEEPDDLPPLQ